MSDDNFQNSYRKIYKIIGVIKISILKISPTVITE